ncbi:MAG: DNA polymerase I, partial [Flavobacteriales bacterium]|nr:DNA polymerase I [Flavobacteriales bacterium]
DYEFVESEEQINELLKELANAKEYCFDTETSALDPIEAEMVGMSFSTRVSKAYYVAVNGKEDPVLKRFESIFRDDEKVMIGQNLKYDLKILSTHGVEVKNQLWDTMIAHYLMNPDLKHGMDVLAEQYLKYKPVSIETLIGKKGKNQKSMADLEPAAIADYAAEDADITLQLKKTFQSEIEKDHLHKLFHEVEIPLMRVLAGMELEGVNINKQALRDYSEKLGEEINSLEKTIHEQAGEEFNIDSPKQLGPILFEKLKISSKAKKTKTGQYSTSEDVLSKHTNDHPIVPSILRYRQLRKLKSTYVDPLPDMVSEKTTRLHTNYMQTVAATGRLSSNNPNLQNIPIRTEEGRYIREAFIPRNDDYTILAADYSQVELRIIAALSEDDGMCEAFINGADIHAATAAKVFGVDIDEVDREMRSKAKAVNFGIVYGQGAFGLAQNLGISRGEAKEIIDNYKMQFGKLEEYKKNNVEFARKNGYVETILGRRRYLKDINSSNAVVRGFAERNAVNAPIQGSAADVIKVAMVNLHKIFQKEGFQSKMIMQVHDELVFDAHKSELDIIQPIIKKEMEGAEKLRVPLDVSIDLGETWLSAH